MGERKFTHKLRVTQEEASVLMRINREYYEPWDSDTDATAYAMMTAAWKALEIKEPMPVGDILIQVVTPAELVTSGEVARLRKVE